MNIYRSYIEKNNTIVKNSSLNSANNQVTEIAYGGSEKILSKYIFKINLNDLKNKIQDKEITIDYIDSHILHFKNTINLSTSNQIYSQVQERASSFDLVLFKINETWSEGNGYDIILNNTFSARNKNTNASNWYFKETNSQWGTPGINNVNNIEIVNTLHFNNGDEDFITNITEYINTIIYTSGSVDYGLGISFPLEYENIITTYIQSVNFHTNKTNTFFEPYLETKFKDEFTILDDRNCFHLDINNRLYFFAKRGNVFYDVNITEVKIYNNNNEVVNTIPLNLINKRSKGVYYVDINLNSTLHIDGVLFKDEWTYELNNETKTTINSFYIMSELVEAELENNLTSLKMFGIYNGQNIVRGELINIDFNFSSLFSNIINYCDYEFGYNLYVKYGENNIYLIEDGLVNRVPNKYFISFDTKIFIPNNYYLDINLKYRNELIKSVNINFRILE